jgi:PAS domain S-box-containing protein
MTQDYPGEAHYRELVEQSIVGIALIRRGRLTFANKRLCEILGRAPAELAWRDLRELVHPEDHPILNAVFERRRAGETGPIAVDCRALRGDDGSMIYARVETKAIRIDGAPAAIAIVQDFTEQALAERRLRESEAKYRLLWETSADAVVLLDERLRIRYANPALLEVFGYAASNMQGREFLDLIPLRLRPRYLEVIKRYFVSGMRTLNWRATEIRGLHADGREFPLEVSFNHARVNGGSFFSVFLRDISERHHARTQLEVANERLRELSRCVHRLREDERRKVAFELQEEIGQSVFALRIALERLTSDLAAESRVIGSECIALADAIRKKLFMLSAELDPPELEDQGLEEALHALVQRRQSGSEVSIACQTRVAGAQRRPALERACFRICEEALENAMRHSSARSIVVELETTADSIELAVRDDGVGFDLALAKLDSARAGKLGLFWMKEYAQLAGGRIYLQSEPNAGTCLRAVLPTREDAAA